MKYSKFGILKLAVAINKVTCLEDINSCIVNEGCIEIMPFFMNGEVLLNMDSVERQIAAEESRRLFKSMDSAIVITDNISKLSEILLVEFRFNYTNLKNIDKNDLFGKVNGSTSALNGSPININTNYIFIFNSNLKQQAIRRFRNMVPSMPTHYIATDIIDLKATYF